MTASVRKESSAAQSNAKHWPMIAALIGGTSAMRVAGEEYLPKWPNEGAEAYKSRLKVATLYPAFSRTVDILASKPFSKALALSDDTPSRIVEWCEDADLQGRNLHAFAAARMAECISYGVTGVLVDYPKTDGVNTEAQEIAVGARPFLVAYPPGHVLGWKTENISGAERLTQIRLLEYVTEDDGDFGEKTIEQVRVLRRGSWEIWRKSERSDSWLLYDEGSRTLPDIPFVFFYGVRTGFGTGKSPLVELAFQNVEHWQSCSDQQTILHVARVPILTIIGADTDKQITVGAASAVNLPVGADMRFVEHGGAAIEAGRQSIIDLEDRMRQTGAELLVLQPGKITATQVQSENEGNKCALQRIAEIFEDSLDQCLAIMAAWVNEAVAGSVTLFKDFGSATLAEASAQLLLQANQAGKISDETLFSEFKRRGILSPDSTWEDEQERISDQGPALGNKAA